MVPFTTRRNTILVVDDHPQRVGFYWQILNDDPEEFSPLPPQNDTPRQRDLVLHPLGDFSQFEAMFRQMVECGDRYPLCIVDMQLWKPDGRSDNRRGFQTIRLVRELDPDINILVATHLPEGSVDLEDVRAAGGDKSFLFRMPMSDQSQQEDFRSTVIRLIDDWNAEQRSRRPTPVSVAEQVSLWEVLDKICREWQRENASIERYFNRGLSVRSHREPLAQGLDCVLRHAVETSSPDGSIRVFGEGTSFGAMVTVVYELREATPQLLDKVERALDQIPGFRSFETFLRSAGGSLKPKLQSGGTSATATLAADIRHVQG